MMIGADKTRRKIKVKIAKIKRKITKIKRENENEKVKHGYNDVGDRVDALRRLPNSNTEQGAERGD